MPEHEKNCLPQWFSDQHDYNFPKVGELACKERLKNATKEIALVIRMVAPCASAHNKMILYGSRLSARGNGSKTNFKSATVGQKCCPTIAGKKIFEVMSKRECIIY